MKINRHGQAKVLSPQEISRLWSVCRCRRDAALVACGLYTGARIGEVVQLRTVDVRTQAGRGDLLPVLTYRRGTTKGKLATRTIPMARGLRDKLRDYAPAGEWLFPSSTGEGHIDVDSAARILKRLFLKAAIDGASSHSLRRTCLTQLSRSGTPLRVIQRLSGHKSLAALQLYLEVKDEDVSRAVAQLEFGWSEQMSLAGLGASA